MSEREKTGKVFPDQVFACQAFGCQKFNEQSRECYIIDWQWSLPLLTVL